MPGGGGGGGSAFGPTPFLLGAAKGLLPCFLVPKGNQPTACTLALWWLKFGRGGRGGRGQRTMGRVLSEGEIEGPRSPSPSPSTCPTPTMRSPPSVLLLGLRWAIPGCQPPPRGLHPRVIAQRLPDPLPQGVILEDPGHACISSRTTLPVPRAGNPRTSGAQQRPTNVACRHGCAVAAVDRTHGGRRAPAL